MTATRLLHVTIGGSLLFASPSLSSVASIPPPVLPPVHAVVSTPPLSLPTTSALRLTFPGHTHLTVKPGYTLVVSYRSPACPLQIRRDPATTVATVDSSDDARGLTVNGGEMLGNVGSAPCYLGVVLYPAASLSPSAPISAPSANAR